MFGPGRIHVEKGIIVSFESFAASCCPWQWVMSQLNSDLVVSTTPDMESLLEPTGECPFVGPIVSLDVSGGVGLLANMAPIWVEFLN